MLKPAASNAFLALAISAMTAGYGHKIKQFEIECHVILN
jgi:hypothetical protein